MWHQSIFGTQLPHVGSDWLRHRSTTLSPGALQLTNTFGVVLRQVRQSFAKPCRTRLPQNHTAHTPRPNRTGYEVPEIAVAIMVENIRCDTTRCTNESLQPIHHTREWDQTWAEPEHRVVMGMGFRRGNSGQASPDRWCAVTVLWPMMRSNCCGQWCVAIVVGGVCRRLQWAVDGDMANLVGRVSHATFCGTARPLTHDHHSRRAPPMFSRLLRHPELASNRILTPTQISVITTLERLARRRRQSAQSSTLVRPPCRPRAARRVPDTTV